MCSCDGAIFIVIPIAILNMNKLYCFSFFLSVFFYIYLLSFFRIILFGRLYKTFRNFL